MMSVLVKGMKMPDSCAVCRFAGKGGYHMERVVCMFTGKNEDAENVDRLSDCPLVALPDKHGRLVDADADSLKNKLKFINEAEHQIYGRGSWGFTAKCIHAIDDAPTVIEAEDDE